MMNAPGRVTDASKITILLADQDALRRDGLAAIILQHEEFEVVAGVPDGEQALRGIRDLRPHVAVVNLDLPVLHGVELVRCVRREALATKIIIVAGTTDEETVREVVQAGGDAYLLKNGPARHLIDAVSYVRDGGRYFSPQLKRDRVERGLPGTPEGIPFDSFFLDGESSPESENSNSSRSRSTGMRRQPRRSGTVFSFRDRSREQLAGREPAGPDRDLKSLMADGIRPLLERLDFIDSQISQMDGREEPLKDSGPRLTTQLAGSVGLRPIEMVDICAAADLEANLPVIIEDAVLRRFHEMAGKLQDDIQETHVRALETFVKNVQTRLVHRVSALEQDMATQAQAMTELQQYSQRTEENLSRLISGVDKLARELPQRAGAPVQEQIMAELAGESDSSLASPRKIGRSAGRSSSLKKMWVAMAVVSVLALAGWGAKTGLKRMQTAASDTAGLAVGPGPEKPAQGRGDIPTETNARLVAAKQDLDRKDYPKAEDLFRQVIKAEPFNTEALEGLASVLYRQNKIEEATAVLDKLPVN